MLIRQPSGGSILWELTKMLRRICLRTSRISWSARGWFVSFPRKSAVRWMHGMVELSLPSPLILPAHVILFWRKHWTKWALTTIISRRASWWKSPRSMLSLTSVPWFSRHNPIRKRAYARKCMGSFLHFFYCIYKLNKI